MKRGGEKHTRGSKRKNWRETEMEKRSKTDRHERLRKVKERDRGNKTIEKGGAKTYTGKQETELERDRDEETVKERQT